MCLQIVLVLGTKLEVVVAEMALEIHDQSSVIKGAPLVRLDNSLFWFSHPKYVLPLIHFTLFMVCPCIYNILSVFVYKCMCMHDLIVCLVTVSRHKRYFFD